MSSKKSRIIYIADIRFPMERANAIQSVNTCHALAEHGNEVFFLVRKMNDLTDEECLAYYGLKPHPDLHLKRLKVINSGKSFFIWKMSFILSSLLTLLKLSFTSKKLIYFTRDLRLAWIYRKISHFFRAKVIFEAHTINYRHFEEIHTLYSSMKLTEKRKLRKKKRLENAVYKRMDGIIVITEHLKQQLIVDFSPKCEVIVVRDAAKPTKEFKPRKDRSGVYYIGQLYPWKGVDLLLESFKKIEDERLYIVGGLEYEDDLKNLKKYAEKLGIREKVIFKGTVPHSEVAQYVRKAKICAIPLPFSQIAAYYTSPMKMFEYLAEGKAIVASDLPSLAEVLENRKNAVLFKPGSEKSLTHALKTVLENDSLREKLEKNAWKTSHLFSWEKRAEKITSLINSI